MSNFKSLRKFALTSLRNEKQTYLVYLKNWVIRRLWTEVRNIKIEDSNKPKLPENPKSPQEINNYFMPVFSDNIAKDEICKFYIENKFNVNNFSYKITEPSTIHDIIYRFQPNASFEKGQT